MKRVKYIAMLILFSLGVSAQRTVRIRYQDGNPVRYILRLRAGYYLTPDSNGTVTLDTARMILPDTSSCYLEILSPHSRAMFLQGLYFRQQGSRDEPHLPFDSFTIRQLMAKKEYFIRRNINLVDGG